MSIISPEENVAFYEFSEEGLKVELADVTAETTRLGEFLECMRAQMGYLRENMAAKNVVARYIGQDSCANLGTFITGEF